MEIKYKVVIAVSVVLASYATGRFMAPEKIKIQKEVVEVEKKTEQVKTDIERDKHKQTITFEVVRPDGTRETTTKINEDTTTDKKQDLTKTDDSSKTSIETKEVTKSSKKLNLSVLAGIGFPPSTLIYGGHVSTSLIGPISIGVWGLSNATGGFSLGLDF